MKILVINADCIFVNSSANLCHLAYIQGLVDAGHQVDVLCADSQYRSIDPSMLLPESVRCFTFPGMSLYEWASIKFGHPPAGHISADTGGTMPGRARVRRKLVQAAKRLALSAYGIHGIYSTFVRKAAAFWADTDYDYVLSLSTPVASHLLTHNLLKKKHIRAGRWIQIWEDPWHSDVYGYNGADKIRKEEQRLLSFAEKVCYVSPLTLKNQQEKYLESAHKMYWQPLPFYYKSQEVSGFSFKHNRYGYFGDYAPAARNLAPFYEAAKETGIEVNICGNPSNLFTPTDHIHIHPRLPLDKLKPIEDSTNVLVFLCNRQGGQIPGKIYQYSATNKTVLFIMDGTAEEQEVLQAYFGKFNRYIFCQNTREDIVRAIRQIEAGDLGFVKNQPLDVFNPTTTINNILKAGS